ncbi:2-methylcitrate dehydratase PrpD [Azospirillum oryzae]|uniref:2-methylcitrate dehydratase PrpD n=1 Tax=Azospirillum oryzae TaxID=286727 RepID=A0A1X7HPI1_9PROT|nr:MmgE/PrpD family protein [Azospirillum oryzae]SMF89983.1 2-methylcitrate dehydratase PrpD [Azospirillum oryzae]
MHMDDIGSVLARFATGFSGTQNLDYHVATFVNWYGCTVGGTRSSTVDRAVRSCQDDGSGTFLPPIGRTETLSASASVLIDCLSSACLAYDDIHFETTLHPAGPVAAAIFGLSRSRPVSGADAINALCLGMEIECRVALAMFGPKAQVPFGWYPTGLAGGIGAAAAVGHLLGFDEAQVCNAFGLAAARASGTRGTHGAMAASYVPALAAESGYVAAKLTQAGFTCDIASLSGRNGLIGLVASTPDREAALGGLGRTFVCETTAFKAYPTGFISHAAMECCLDLHAQALRQGRRLERLDVFVSPVAHRLGGNSTPANGFEAMVSLSYLCARVICDPDSAFEPIADAFVIPADVAQTQALITVTGRDDLTDQQCLCEATFGDGSVLSLSCSVPLGSVQKPLSDAMIDRKFRKLVTPVYGETAADDCLLALRNIRSMENIATLIDPKL